MGDLQLLLVSLEDEAFGNYAKRPDLQESRLLHVNVHRCDGCDCDHPHSFRLVVYTMI